MSILAIDPGIKMAGWATYDGNVIKCGLARSDTAHWAHDVEHFRRWAIELPQGDVDGVIIERPQIYTHDKSKGDPEDIARLLIVCGRLAEIYRSSKVVLVKPHDWKGTIPKPSKLEDYIVHKRNARAIGHYIPSSVPKSLAHNVADAVGLLLWYWEKGAKHQGE